MLHVDLGGSEDGHMREYDSTHDPLTSCIFCGESYAPDSRNWWDDYTCMFCHDEPSRINDMMGHGQEQMERTKGVLIGNCA